jgi:hypothetical protein
MLQVAKACLRIYFWMQWQLVKSSPQKVKTAGKWDYSDYQVGFPLSLTRMDGWMGITFLQFASGFGVGEEFAKQKQQKLLSLSVETGCSLAGKLGLCSCVAYFVGDRVLPAPFF